VVAVLREERYEEQAQLFRDRSRRRAAS
jgi:hypothetical protein